MRWTALNLYPIAWLAIVAPVPVATAMPAPLGPAPPDPAPAYAASPIPGTAQDPDRAYELLAEEYANLRSSLGPVLIGEAGGDWIRRDFEESFRELAEAGSRKAMAWCAAHYVGQGTPSSRAFLLGVHQRLVSGFRGETWLFEGELDLEISQRALVPSQAEELSRRLTESVSQGVLEAPAHALALYSRAVLTSPWGQAENRLRRRSVEFYARAVELGLPALLEERAQNASWRLEHLSIGHTAPDFTTLDVDKNEIRLSDLRGWIVVVDFWSLDEVDFERQLATRRALVATHRERPFVLLGINLDTDAVRYRREREELEIDWPSSFEGGPLGRVPGAWKVRGAPTRVVLDEQGVIRAVGLSGSDLLAVVAELTDELTSRRPPSSAPPSSRGEATTGD